MSDRNVCPVCLGIGTCDRPTKIVETELHMIGYRAGVLAVADFIGTLRRGHNNELRRLIISQFHVPNNRPEDPPKKEVVRNKAKQKAKPKSKRR